jgi:ABC-type glycerol-3-phosphate transport system substrate-binding protein
MEKTTQDGIWYQLTPDMDKYNVKVTREWIKKLIRKVCDKLGVTRESLGIFAGARATMYFDGNWSNVRFDAISGLAEKGTDILFVEKMPIVEVLTEYADKYGVALVNTIGNLTEYGKDLIRAIMVSGGHAAILTDYEDYGHYQ